MRGTPTDTILKCKYAYMYIPNGDIYVSCRPLLETMHITEAFLMEEWEEVALPEPDILRMLINTDKYIP